MFFAFRVAPDQGLAVRFFVRYGVHDVVGEVEVLRVVEGEFLKAAVLVKDFRAVFLVYAHVTYLLSVP